MPVQSILVHCWIVCVVLSEFWQGKSERFPVWYKLIESSQPRIFSMTRCSNVMWFVCGKHTRFASKLLTKRCRGSCALRSVTFSLPSWPVFSPPPASPAVLLCPRPSLGLCSKDWSPFRWSYSHGTGLHPSTTRYRLTLCRGSHVPVLLHGFFFPRLSKPYWIEVGDGGVECIAGDVFRKQGLFPSIGYLFFSDPVSQPLHVTFFARLCFTSVRREALPTRS